MKLLYGTGNPAKISAMRQRLKELDIELTGLEDMKEQGYEIPVAPENGSTPLENARQKALAYYKAFHMPVFSCDQVCILTMFQMKSSLEYMYGL